MSAIMFSKPTEQPLEFEPHRNPDVANLPSGSIIDIGGSKLDSTMKIWLEEKLFQKHGHQLRKSNGTLQYLLPSPLLSTDEGLDLWREINRLPGYYQTCDEVELFEVYGKEIARYVPEGASLIDLGSGDVRKIKPFLDIFESNKKRVQYYALDLSRQSLEKGMNEICHQFEWVQCFGLWGLFSEGVEWVKNIPSPRLICSLGSSLGNDWFLPSVAHLRRWSNTMNPQDRMLLGMDSCKNRQDLWRSYHDAYGLFESFIRKGLEQSNIVMGDNWYHAADWDVSGIFHQNPTMHQFAITANKDVFCAAIDTQLPKGTQIDCYEAFKYDPLEMCVQFEASGLCQVSMWQSPSTRIFQYLLCPAVQTPKI